MSLEYTWLPSSKSVKINPRFDASRCFKRLFIPLNLF